MSLRILQSSDWHFGATVLPAGHSFGRELEKLRRSEEELILDRIIKIARDEEVDIVLLPGDLWDQENVPFSIVRDIIVKLGSLAPLPVIISPGNHDFLGKESLYFSENISTYGAQWPDNVFIFNNFSYESIKIDGLAGVSFTGMAAGANLEIHERLISSDLPKSSSDINILLHHGSRVSDSGNFPYKSKITAPFSDEEILNSGFDYVALGHYHAHQIVKDDVGKIKAAYSGEPFARQFRNIIDNGVLVFDLDKGGVNPESFSLIKVDERSYRRIEKGLTGGYDEHKAYENIEARLKEEDISTSDFVQVKLTGRFGAGKMWRPSMENRELAFAIDVDTSALMPDFDIKQEMKESPVGSAEHIFIERMQARLNDPDLSDYEKQITEMALQIGFYAFRDMFTELHTDPVEESI